MDLTNTKVKIQYSDDSVRELIKFTGSYKYNPIMKQSWLDENPLSNIEHKGIDNLRSAFKKSAYMANSNQLYRKVQKTLNLVSRMYDSVYNQYTKQYPDIIKGEMPSIRVQIVDRCLERIERGYWDNGPTVIIKTSSALGNTYLNSTKINLQGNALNRLSAERVENLIMHELGHAIFGLNHCRKRKKKCPLMARYFYQRGKVTHSTNRKTFRKFIKNKYYKSQIKELKEVR